MVGGGIMFDCQRLCPGSTNSIVIDIELRVSDLSGSYSLGSYGGFPIMKLFHRVMTAVCLLLAGFNMHTTAQTFSFPVCKGDASSWHIQLRDPNRSDYTPPVIRTENPPAKLRR
jgi:hypothetical protein